MDYGDYYWGLYRDYYRDPSPPFPTKHQVDSCKLTDLLGGSGLDISGVISKVATIITHIGDL